MKALLFLDGSLTFFTIFMDKQIVFGKYVKKKRILVFPPRDLSKLRFDSSKLASNAHAGSVAGGNYQLNMFNMSLDQNRC